MDRRVGRVTGVVQGVGFRPFVHAAAVRLGLGGFVRNQDGQEAIGVTFDGSGYGADGTLWGG